MDFQFGQLALFIVCLIGILTLFAHSIRAVRPAGFTRYLSGLLFAVKATIAVMSKLVFGFVGFLASSADTSEEQDNAEEGDLTGAYNFRTRKFDNGTDPYGWYEEDL